MAVIGEAFVAVRPDTQGFGPEAERGVLSSVTSIAKKAAVIFGGAFVLRKGFDIGKDAIAQASDLSETVSKVGVVFGQSSDAVLAFGKDAATALGQSEAQALAAAGVFGNLLRSVGLTEEQSAKFSTSLTLLASDLASFNNVDPAEALDALRSGLVGETEPLKRFGVNMNEATLQAKALELGLIKQKGPLDSNVKAQAAYALIMEQTALAQGDFARTSGGLANQQRILAARFTDLKARIGAALLPAITSIVTFVNKVGLPVFTKLADGLGKILTPAFAGIGKVISEVFGANAGPSLVANMGVEIGKLFGFAEDSGFVQLLVRIGDEGKRAFRGLITIIEPLIDLASRLGRFLRDQVLPALLNLGGEALSGLADVAEVVGQFIGYLASPEGETALRIIEGIVAAIVAAKVAEEVAGKINGMVTKVSELREAARTAFPQVRELAGHISSITSKTANVAVTGADKAAAAAKKVADQLAKLVSKSVTISAKATVNVEDAAKKGLNLATSVAAGFAGGIGSLVASHFAPAIGAAISGALAAVGTAIAAAAAALGVSVAALVAGALAVALAVVLAVVFREKIVGFFQRLPGYIATALSKLPGILGEVFGTAAAVIVGIFLGIPALIIVGLVRGIPAIAGVAQRIGGAILRGIGGALSQLPGLIADVVSGLVEGLTGALSAVAGVLSQLPGLVAAAFGELVSFLTRLPGLIVQGLAALPAFLARLPGLAIDAVRGVVRALGSLALDMPNIAREAAGGFISALAGIPGQVADIFGGIIDFITNLPFASVVGDIFGKIADGFRDGWRRVNELTGGALNDLVGAIGRLPGQIGGLIGGIFAKFKELGGKILDGIAEGVRGAVGFVGDFAKGIGNALIGFINEKVIQFINDKIPNKIETPGWLPDINLPDNPLPKIPKLAHGGIAMPRSGGLLANIAEGGTPELVLPLPPGLLAGLDALARLAREGTLGRTLAVTLVAPPERNAGREVIAELQAAETLGII